MVKQISALIVVFFLAGCVGDTSSSKNSIPPIIDHPKPDLSTDLTAFENLEIDECENMGPMDLIGGLTPAYPVATCTGKRYDMGCLYRTGGLVTICHNLVVITEDNYYTITRISDMKKIFAPIESEEEALSYALAVTEYHAKYEPEDYVAGVACCGVGYGTRDSYQYFVDELEDTHVEKITGGYIVYLFDQIVFGCHPLPVYSVPIQVNFDGSIQVDKKIIYQQNDVDGKVLCID